MAPRKKVQNDGEEPAQKRARKNPKNEVAGDDDGVAPKRAAAKTKTKLIVPKGCDVPIKQQMTNIFAPAARSGEPSSSHLRDEVTSPPGLHHGTASHEGTGAIVGTQATAIGPSATPEPGQKTMPMDDSIASTVRTEANAEQAQLSDDSAIANIGPPFASQQGQGHDGGCEQASDPHGGVVPADNAASDSDRQPGSPQTVRVLPVPTPHASTPDAEGSMCQHQDLQDTKKEDDQKSPVVPTLPQETPLASTVAEPEGDSGASCKETAEAGAAPRHEENTSSSSDDMIQLALKFAKSHTELDRYCQYVKDTSSLEDGEWEF